MSKKTIDGVTCELVASASHDKLYLDPRIRCLLYEQLQNDYWDARSEYDSIKKGLALAEFTFDHYGYKWAADEYQSVLSTILYYETGKYPKYKELALRCASMVAQRYFDTDACYDERSVQQVEAFYADKFSQNSFDK